MFRLSDSGEESCAFPGQMTPDQILSYVICKIFNKITTNLVSDLATMSGFSASTALRMSDFAYILLVYGQGSIKTSGTAYMVEEVLKLCGVSKNQSYAAGVVASMAVSLGPAATPLGFAYTAITTGASLTAKFMTQRACEKVQASFKSYANSIRHRK